MTRPISTLAWKTKLHFGRGALARLPELVKLHGARRPLLMVGREAVRKAGHLRRVEELLRGLQVVCHSGISPNPTLEDLFAAIAAVKSCRADCLVALGGGSVLDIAKTSRVLAQSSEADVERFLDGEALPEANLLPCIAIPTTAGTGSELTPWATIWRPEIGKKASLEGPSVPPEEAIVDPELMVSLPADLTASCGLDTFAQAVEAYWASRSQPCSQALSLRAIELVLRSLGTAVRKPENSDAREDVAWACTLTGLSFSQTKTTAAHALSYPLTLHFGVRHGIACAVFIPAVLVFNAEPNPRAYQPLYAACGSNNPTGAAEKIRAFYESVGVSPRLAAYGVTRRDFDRIAEDTLSSPRSLNNPRLLSLADARRLLEESF